ncbi:MAG: anaerobic sulfatase maturase [Candidatus Glassbacteria bacterium]|nr:anaerobic sulfatase maturase [Candidatus Glassbacteria bacterium]
MKNARTLKPFTLLVKPVGSRCNLSCSYCFYLGTDEHLGVGRPGVMPAGVLERMVGDYLSYGFPTSAFTWQGGEPTLAGLEFYKKAVELQMAHGRNGQAVANALQTNGVLLDERWAGFLAEYRFLVGLSLDGPQPLHDHYRKDHRGRPTFDRVMAAAALMRRHRVEFNILSMITAKSERLGGEIYRFLVGEGFRHLQFIPCVEYGQADGKPAPQNCSPRGYGQFLCDVFDCWYPGDVGRVSVRTFEGLVALLAGEPRLSICNLGKVCDHYLVVEKDGGVFPCDFFVAEDYLLGNLMDKPLAKIYLSDRERSFAHLKADLPAKCTACRYLEICYGGCPKDRLAAGGGKFGRPSHLCEGLMLFYEHAVSKLQALAESVRQPRESREKTALPGRNDPCPCGSGRKYKHCCLKS